MLQFFWNAKATEIPAADPLDHPALRAMTSDQLADLPLTPDWPHASKPEEDASVSLANRRTRLCA